MLAGVAVRAVGDFADDGELVADGIDGVVVLEAMGGCDFGCIVVLIERGKPRRLLLGMGCVFVLYSTRSGVSTTSPYSRRTEWVLDAIGAECVA